VTDVKNNVSVNTFKITPPLSFAAIGDKTVDPEPKGNDDTTGSSGGCDAVGLWGITGLLGIVLRTLSMSSKAARKSRT
jgi:hypothetical protein